MEMTGRKRRLRRKFTNTDRTTFIWVENNNTANENNYNVIG